MGRDGFFIGGEATYDIREGLIKGYNAALGFAGPDYTQVFDFLAMIEANSFSSVTVHGLQKFSTFSASYYHKVNSDVDVAAKVSFCQSMTLYTNRIPRPFTIRKHLQAMLPWKLVSSLI